MCPSMVLEAESIQEWCEQEVLDVLKKKGMLAAAAQRGAGRRVLRELMADSYTGSKDCDHISNTHISLI